MRRIRPLPAPAFQERVFLSDRQQGIEQQRLRLPRDQAGTKLAQDGMVEARVGEFSPQDIFPINAAADGICGLAIRQPFGKLEDRGEGQPGRRLCRLAARREERGELRIVVDGAEPVGHLHIDIAMGKCGMGNALGVSRNQIAGMGV